MNRTNQMNQKNQRASRFCLLSSAYCLQLTALSLVTCHKFSSTFITQNSSLFIRHLPLSNNNFDNFEQRALPVQEPQEPFTAFRIDKKYDGWCKKKEGCYPLGKSFGRINPNKKGGHTPCQDFYGRRLYVM